jgi:hypothetical protein
MNSKITLTESFTLSPIKRGATFWSGWPSAILASPN